MTDQNKRGGEGEEKEREVGIMEDGESEDGMVARGR